MRTIDEIIIRCQESDDFFGFDQEVLLPFLPAEKAKPFLREDADLSQWKQHSLEAEVVIDQMREYMEFAWEKVQDHRGLSAGRSISKMQAWLWLLEDDETFDFAQKSSNYPQYGAPILWRICKRYGIAIPEGDDGKPMPIIDTMPPRPPEEQQAIFDGFKADRYRQRVERAAKMGIAEEDIDQIVMSGTDGDVFFVQLRDGRRFTKPISEVYK